MIPTKSIKNVKIASPILNLLVSNPYMDKAYIKTIYPQWNGETVGELSSNLNNQRTIRIGTPNMDQELRADRLYFIQSYLSYNPVTKDIEKRELIPYRNVEKVYIGPQSLEEKAFNNYTAFINGTVIVKDIITIDSRESIKDTLKQLQQRIEFLTQEVSYLKGQLQNQTIYKQ
jgi:hypothetical protein